jgi:hypothetical protein
MAVTLCTLSSCGCLLMLLCVAAQPPRRQGQELHQGHLLLTRAVPVNDQEPAATSLTHQPQGEMRC